MMEVNRSPVVPLISRIRCGLNWKVCLLNTIFRCRLSLKLLLCTVRARNIDEFSSRLMLDCWTWRRSPFLMLLLVMLFVQISFMSVLFINGCQLCSFVDVSQFRYARSQNIKF